MALVQVATNKQLLKNGAVIPSIVFNESLGKYFVVRQLPLDPSRGYFGKIWLEGLTHTEKEQDISNYVTVQSGESLTVAYISGPVISGKLPTISTHNIKV